MKLFDLEGDFFTSVVVFNRLAPEIKPDDFLLFEAALIEHVCEERRNLPIGAYQPDHSELEADGFLALPGAESLKVVV